MSDVATRPKNWSARKRPWKRTTEPVQEYTAVLRRQTRREAAVVLVAAGWELDRIALAFGIALGRAQELLPAKDQPEKAA
jgi:hypothetical protein